MTPFFCRVEQNFVILNTNMQVLRLKTGILKTFTGNVDSNCAGASCHIGEINKKHTIWDGIQHVANFFNDFPSQTRFITF